MKIQKRKDWLLYLIMIISAAGMLYFGAQKEGYHVDEMYSYGLANSQYLPFMHFGESGYDVKDWMNEYGAGESFADLFRNLSNDFKILKEHDFQFYNTPIYRDYRTAQENSSDTRTTTWVSGKDYLDYLAVSESNTFNYASVYYNQRGDVHPPFYYILLHTVCSVFQGTFSKWFGLSVNFIFMLMAIWLLYRMAARYLGGESAALAVAAVYGLSCGFFTCAVFLRMYAVLTFMVVAMCYMHLKISAEEFTFKKSDIIKLALVTFLGYLTHYYFVIYAIGIAAVFVIWMCIKKKWHSVFKYIFTLSVTAAVGLCVWPFAIKHVFSGYRGVDSLNTIMSGQFYWIKIKLILDQIFSQLFLGKWLIPITACGVLVIAAVVYRKRKGILGKGVVIFLPMLLYVIVVAQIVPYYVDRYVMCTYPFWCILVVSAVRKGLQLLSEWCKEKHIFAEKNIEKICQGAFLTAVFFLMIINNGFLHSPGYLGENGQETYTVPENSHCVYVLPDGTWNESAEDTLMLSKCDQVAVVYQSNLPCLENTYEYQEGDCVIVILNKSLDHEAVVPLVKKIMGISHMEESFREEVYNTVRYYYK